MCCLIGNLKIGINMRNKIPITMSMKSAHFMFVIMWLEKRRKFMKKRKKERERERKNKENYDFPT